MNAGCATLCIQVLLRFAKPFCYIKDGLSVKVSTVS